MRHCRVHPRGEGGAALAHKEDEHPLEFLGRGGEKGGREGGRKGGKDEA